MKGINNNEDTLCHVYRYRSLYSTPKKTKYRLVHFDDDFPGVCNKLRRQNQYRREAPFIIDEFHINNFEAGAIASIKALPRGSFSILAGFLSPNAASQIAQHHFRLFRFHR